MKNLPATLRLGLTAPTVLILTGAAAHFARPAHAQTQLIQNGSFETGSLSSAWTTVSQSDAGRTSGFFVADNTNSPGYSPSDPSTGYPFFTPTTPVNDFPTVGPHTGSFYAVSDADGAAANVLFQSFTVPTGATQITLSFALFVNARNGAGALNTNGPLDYSQTTPTQFARVDLLTAGASPFSLGAGNVIRNFYLGVDPNVGPITLYPIPYKTYSFDITRSALAGGTYQLRFADVGNQEVLNTGVDDVSVLALGPTAAGAPEPASVLLMSVLLVGRGLALVAKRRRLT